MGKEKTLPQLLQGRAGVFRQSGIAVCRFAGYLADNLNPFGEEDLLAFVTPLDLQDGAVPPVITILVTAGSGSGSRSSFSGETSSRAAVLHPRGKRCIIPVRGDGYGKGRECVPGVPVCVFGRPLYRLPPGHHLVLPPEGRFFQPELPRGRGDAN